MYQGRYSAVKGLLGAFTFNQMRTYSDLLNRLSATDAAVKHDATLRFEALPDRMYQRVLSFEAAFNRAEQLGPDTFVTLPLMRLHLSRALGNGLRDAQESKSDEVNPGQTRNFLMQG